MIDTLIHHDVLWESNVPLVLCLCRVGFSSRYFSWSRNSHFGLSTNQNPWSFSVVWNLGVEPTMAARRADQTARSGWDGDLMDLQNETQKLLATVRTTPSRSRGSKTSDRKAPRVDDGVGKKKKKRKQKTTTEEKKTPSKTTLDLGRETVEVLDTASNPVSARSSGSEDEYDLKKNIKGVGSTTRFQQTKQEITSRNLDFDTETSRVTEVYIYMFNL